MAEHIYDKAKYHFSGKWPAGLDPAQAYVHSGLFLGWLIERGLGSEFFQREAAEEIRRFRARKLTAPKLFERFDGVLTSDMLSPEGNAFAREYFELESGPYATEYDQLLADGLDTPYHVADTWENYDRLKHHLDQRFAEWRSRSG